MKSSKKEFKYFTITQWKEEEEYLRSMHKKGWKLNNISFPGIYKFVSCEPEDMIYKLDYNPDGLNDKDNYLQLFQDCGWDHVQEFVSYSYFRKPADKTDGNEDIFNDDASRLDMMHKIFKFRIIPILFIFLFFMLPNIIRYYNSADSFGKSMWIFYLFISALIAAVVVAFISQYILLKKQIKK